MDAAFLQERITVTKALIVAYEEAMLFFAENGSAQSYKLDTGQSIQSVTRADIGDMQRILDGLYNRCATMEARLNGSGSVIVNPAW